MHPSDDIKAGDLVFALYNHLGEGTIYRVESREPRGILKLRPVFSFQGPKHMGRLRTLGAGWARKVKEEDLVDRLSELDSFLKELRAANKSTSD